MKFEYCVAIRTLGTAGDKYYQTLLSLKQQNNLTQKDSCVYSGRLSIAKRNYRD